MGRSWLGIGLLVAGLSFQVAAIGCGDDDDDTTGSVAGQGGAGKGGSGGKAGTASAGKGGSGGGVSVDQCVSQTNEIVKDSFSSECLECGCKAKASAFTACNGDENCWKLLACISQVCGTADASNPTYLTCAQTTAPAGACKDFATASASAAVTGVGTIFLLNCSTQCAQADDKDAGADAGN